MWTWYFYWCHSYNQWTFRCLINVNSKTKKNWWVITWRWGGNFLHAIISKNEQNDAVEDEERKIIYSPYTENSIYSEPLMVPDDTVHLN